MKPRVYLDIDGVLNSKKGDAIAKKDFPSDWALLKDGVVKHKHLLHKFWDKEAVKNLKYILETIDVDIYIHSSWKHHFKLNDFKKFFDYWNLDSSKIMGIVPQYKLSSERYHDLSWHISGDRISTKDVPACTKYVVIDDYNMTDIFADRDVFKTRQVVTDSDVGLTLVDAKKALDILK